jgi:hypothetical protein
MYEQNFVKEKKLLEFYEDLLDFLVKAINNSACSSQEADKHTLKQVYMRKFLISVYVQFYSVCCSNDSELVEEKQLMDRYYPAVQAAFGKKFVSKLESRVPATSADMDSIHLGMEALELVDLLKEYAKQLRRKSPAADASPSCRSAKAADVNSKYLKVNAQMEKNLKLKFSSLFADCIAKQSLYHCWLFNNLIDLFLATVNGLVSGSLASYTKMIQESLLDAYATIVFLFAENSKYLFILNEKTTDNLPKMAFYKPINLFNSIAKLFDVVLKTSKLSQLSLVKGNSSRNF